MTLKQRIAVGVLTAVPFVAMAQEAPQQPNPLDANASIPALPYDSALKNYLHTGRDKQASPDKVWRAANEQVAKSGGHGGPPAEAATAPAAPAPAVPMDHSQQHKH